MKLPYKHADTRPPTPESHQAGARSIPGRRLQRTLNHHERDKPGFVESGECLHADLARDVVGTQPILAIFLAIGLGYLVGPDQYLRFARSAWGPSCLSVSRSAGWFRRRRSPARSGSSASSCSLYGIGILYGRQFLRGHDRRGRAQIQSAGLGGGRRRIARSLGIGHLFGIKIGHTLGLFAGSMTSTATLQAALGCDAQQRPLRRILVGRLTRSE